MFNILKILAFAGTLLDFIKWIWGVISLRNAKQKRQENYDNIDAAIENALNNKKDD